MGLLVSTTCRFTFEGPRYAAVPPLRRLICCMRGEWTFIPDGSGTVMPRPMSSSHFVGAISSVRHLLVPPLAGHPHRLVHMADGLADAVPNPSSIASTNRCKIN